jgi:tubulin-specific chaperone A
MADPRLKQIRIKTGVVNRIAKEKQSYETETETEKNRLLKFKENGKSLKCTSILPKRPIFI